MQLVVVGSKLKRLPIHLIYGTNGREQRISGRFPILGMTHRDYNSNTFKMFLYQCNLITHNMGENSVCSLIPMKMPTELPNDSRSINPSNSIA